MAVGSHFLCYQLLLRTPTLDAEFQKIVFEWIADFD